jgi:hypothetical protein
MGRAPHEVWALQPWETADLIQGWNDAQAGDTVSPPTSEEYDRLVAKYV